MDELLKRRQPNGSRGLAARCGILLLVAVAVTADVGGLISKALAGGDGVAYGSGYTMGGCCEAPLTGCCSSPAVCCRPWTASADALFLSRSRSDSVGLMFSNNPVTNNPDQEILNGRDLDQDLAVGPRLSLKRCLNCRYDFELTYFGIDGWDTEFSRPTPFHVSFPGFVQGYGVPANPAAGTGAFASGSDLYSVEANLLRKVSDDVSLLLGFRWLQLDDSLHFRFTPAAGATRTDLAIDADNDLFGLQTGAVGTLFERGAFSLVGWGKAGVYHNDAGQISRVDLPFLPLVGATNDSDEDTSFVGDIGLIGIRRVSDCWAIRAGYQLLWINNVALAPEQLTGINDVTVPVSVVNNRGDVFYHGALLGLQANW